MGSFGAGARVGGEVKRRALPLKSGESVLSACADSGSANGPQHTLLANDCRLWAVPESIIRSCECDELERERMRNGGGKAKIKGGRRLVSSAAEVLFRAI